MNVVTATNYVSGEIITLPVDTPEQIATAWKMAQDYGKVADKLKDQLKAIVPNLVDESGRSPVLLGKYQFIVRHIQRKNYDKALLREHFDEDLLDIMLKPDKPAIDKYLKENLESLGQVSHILRTSMVDEGKAFPMIKLDRI